MTSTEGTELAPARRASLAELEREIALACGHPAVSTLLESVAAAVAVLNPERQIIAANLVYLELVGGESPLGLRPGESLRCAHVPCTEGGCGTGRTCLTCGAALAILSAQREGRPTELECALRRRRGDALDDLAMAARAVPFKLEGQPLLLLVLKDISGEKRQAGLQRIFLHDLNNLLVGILSASEELAETRDGGALASEIHLIAARMTRVIALERAFAEDPTRCRAHPERLSLREEVVLLARMAARHPAAAGKTLETELPEGRLELESDAVVLERVVLNMLLNAFEATPEGGAIRLSIEEREGEVSLRVWNRGAIPPEIRPRIFQRYFTTRGGLGRGQGTFAIKHLGEDTLGGRVGFTSGEEGTTFSLTLSRRFPREAG
jgi:signal transduction histidine kinase